jgi:protocatechuate 3,4-dioxygenase beta subunit
MKWQPAVRFTVVLMAAIILASGICCADAEKTFPISGKVLKPDGSPAAGATIEARTHPVHGDWLVKATAVSAADGKFTIRLPQGSYRFWASAQSLATSVHWDMYDVGPDGKLSKPILLKMAKGCRVEGSVVDATTGQPVSGVEIRSREGDIARSDDNGAWHVILPLGNQTIIAVKDGFSWPVIHFNCSGDTVAVKVDIRPGGTIKGRVVDEEGQPIAGARVSPDPSNFGLQIATTDPEGRFALVGQDPDAAVTVSASAESYEFGRRQEVSFAAGQREASIEIKLQKIKLRKITGRVTRPNGSPVEGATVGYGWGSAHYWDYSAATTDKYGHYKLQANVARSLVVVTKTGQAPAWKQIVPAIDVQMDFLMKPAHSVEGTIEDQDGKPLAGAYVSASMPVKNAEVCDNMYSVSSATTGEDGRFKLENLPEGEVYADVYLDSYSRLENERLKVDRKDYTLVLSKSPAQNGSIAGTVVRDSDGKPIADFNVRINASRSGYGISSQLAYQGMTFQAPDGRFSIGDLEVGKACYVIVMAPGYLQASAGPIIAKPLSEKSYSGQVVRLRPASPFEGVVVEAETGDPIEGVVVKAWDTEGYGWSGDFPLDMPDSGMKGVSARTDASGRFRIESLPFTLGAVKLEKQGFARTWLKTVRFTEPLRTSLDKGATIIGTAPAQLGRTPTDGRIDFQNTDLGLYSYGIDGKVQPDGSFKVVDLPAGHYMVTYYPEGTHESTAHQSFELKSGQTYQVDWEKQGPVKLEGRVTNNGKPVAQAEVSANARRPGAYWCGSVKTEKDGSYELTLSKPGTYLINCHLGEWTDPNRSYGNKTLELVEGTNKLDFHLPYSSISGRLVDKLTGRPVPNANTILYIRDTYQHRMGTDAGVTYTPIKPMWLPANRCKTGKDGKFTVPNLRAGEWLVCVSLSDEGDTISSVYLRLADGEAKTGLIAKLPPTGSAKFRAAGMKTFPKRTMLHCFDHYGKMYSARLEKTGWTQEFENLPVGKMTVMVQGNDYLPSWTTFEVKADETSSVSMKLVKGCRILLKCKAHESVPIDFVITTMDGKPVVQKYDGTYWGGTINWRDGVNSIIVKPGTYRLKAGIPEDPNHSYGCKDTVWTYNGIVKVVAGRDTIVEVPLE